METTDKQEQNKRIETGKKNIAPFMWKKGQSGNILGRPKGKTMKEWAREYMERMTDEERDEFMEGIPKEVIWKMAEGNPKQDVDSKVDGTLQIVVPAEVAKTFNINATNTETGGSNN
jgi:hypothetical protein